MIVQGMPWPLVLPMALGMLIWGITRSKNQLKSREQSLKKKSKNNKS